MGKRSHETDISDEETWDTNNKYNKRARRHKKPKKITKKHSLEFNPKICENVVKNSKTNVGGNVTKDSSQPVMKKVLK